MVTDELHEKLIDNKVGPADLSKHDINIKRNQNMIKSTNSIEMHESDEDNQSDEDLFNNLKKLYTNESNDSQHDIEVEKNNVEAN